MEERRYKTAFIIHKICEIIGWIVVVLGVISILYGIRDFPSIPFFGILISVIGLLLVVSAQIVLIFIDTENNTRQTMLEVRRTNAMLAETIGSIAANLAKIVEKIKEQK